MTYTVEMGGNGNYYIVATRPDGKIKTFYGPYKTHRSAEIDLLTFLGG